MKNKLILVDVDGVLLHWEWAFDRWMCRHGFKKTGFSHYSIAKGYNITEERAAQLINMYNETIFAATLPPFQDAIHYVTKLHKEHGYVFHAITSFGDAPEVVTGRTNNLHRLFGSSTFYRITCLNPSVSKLLALSEYENSQCVWVEDHPTNYEIGLNLCLNAFLMDHPYNADYSTAKRVHSWKDIYNEVV